MKVYIISVAIFLVLSISFLFQTKHDQFILLEELVKSTANQCANTAALYYEEEAYSEGHKVFKKQEGNIAIKRILQESLGLKEDMTFQKLSLTGHCDYMVTYFDETGLMTSFHNGIQSEEKDITFPYLFREVKSGYEKKIERPMVIVTIDVGRFSYRIATVDAPQIIRTSGYEER